MALKLSWSTCVISALFCVFFLNSNAIRIVFHITYIDIHVYLSCNIGSKMSAKVCFLHSHFFPFHLWRTCYRDIYCLPTYSAKKRAPLLLMTFGQNFSSNSCFNWLLFLLILPKSLPKQTNTFLFNSHQASLSSLFKDLRWTVEEKSDKYDLLGAPTGPPSIHKN